MVIYKLVGRTNPTDWAERARDVDMGLYERRETAERDMERLRLHPDFYMDWDYIEIVEVTLR